MPSSFWKVTALVGVMGLGCLIVLHAQQGMSDGTSTAADSVEDLDEVFQDLNDDVLDQPDEGSDDSESSLALNTETAASGDDSNDAGFDWEPTPASDGSNRDNPFDSARTVTQTQVGSVTSTVFINEEDEDLLVEDNDVIDAEDVIVEADGVAVGDDADSDDILLAANDTPAAWANEGSSTGSTSSSIPSQTGGSPFLVLPSGSGSTSSPSSSSTSPSPSSNGPSLRSLPSEFNSPALLPTPSDAAEDDPESNPSPFYLQDDVQFFPAGPETQLSRTRQTPQAAQSGGSASESASTTVTAAGGDNNASTGAVTNPFGTSTSTGSSQPTVSTPRTLSFPAAGSGSSASPSASSSVDPFAPSSVPATSQGASSVPSSIPRGASTASSNPFGQGSTPETTTSNAPAPIRVSTPGRVTLDDPATSASNVNDIEPTPAQSATTPANPFPLTTSPRPIDASSQDQSTEQPARISFPSVNPSTNPVTNSNSPFSSSIPSTPQSPAATSDSDSTSNPFPAGTADAPSATVPNPFPAGNSLPGATSPQSAPIANSYVGDGTVEGIVSSSHQPELQIEKVAPPQAVVGEFVIYEIHVRNVGQSAAHQVVVEDRIPLGTELKGTIPRAELVGTQLLWRLGTMEPGAQEIIKVRVIPTAAGEIGSVATVSFRAEVAATTVVTAPALSVDMNGPSEMAMGEEGSYHFTIRNDGDGEARDVVIVTMLPEGLAHPGGQELEYAVGNIAPGEVRTADLVLTAAAAGSVSPVAQVTIAGQVQDQAQLDINLLESRLEVRRQGPIRRFVGRPATYTNTVTNLSSQPLQNVAVIEAIPNGLDLATVPEGGRFDPIQRTITWTIPQLTAHESREFRSSIVAAQEGEWEGSLLASDASGNRAQLATQIDVAGFSSLLVDVEHAGQPVLVGEQVSMRLTIRNAGTAAARNVQAVVEVPAELEFVTAQGPVSHSIAGRTVTFDAIEGLDASGDASFDIVFTASARGDARVRMSLTSADLENPIVQEQAVRIFDEN